MRFLFEGVESLKIAEAAKDFPYKLKKYIVDRLEKAGIKIDQKRTFEKQYYSTSNTRKDSNNLYGPGGIQVKTRETAPDYEGRDQTIDIALKASGEQLTIDFSLYNEHHNVQMQTPGTTVEDLLDRIVSSFPVAKKNLISAHEEKAKRLTKDKIGRTSFKNKIDDFESYLEGFEFEGVDLNVQRERKRGMFGSDDESAVIIQLRFDNQNYLERPGNSERRKVAQILTNIMQDPYVKGKMEKYDKLEKGEMGFRAPPESRLYVHNRDKIVEAFRSLIDYLDGYDEYKINSAGFGVGYRDNDPHVRLVHKSVLSGSGRKEKASRERAPRVLSKPQALREVLKELSAMKTNMVQSYNNHFEKGSRYGHLVIKRLLDKHEKYW